MRGLPKGFNLEVVELFFENEAKSGGGPIRAFLAEPGPSPSQALITYKQSRGNVVT